MLSAPDETRDETPSMVWLYMAHVIDFPPIWDLLDHQPAAKTLQFTDLLNGCSPDAPISFTSRAHETIEDSPDHCCKHQEARQAS